jgi:hypothetical protein
MSIQSFARWALGTMMIAEGAAAWSRHDTRTRLFLEAAQRAKALQRPLVVIGDPDAGMHTRLRRAYGCGDVCVDANGCAMCPVVRVADITAGPVPGIADDSAVVFVSCVLEYVGDLAAALREVQRMAGDVENIYVVTVQPWTLTASLYPGARWAGIAHKHVVSMAPITRTHKAIAAGVLAGASLLALLPHKRKERP